MAYLILIFILVIADQISKYLTISNMKIGETIPLIDHFFNITYVENRGVAFGILQGKQWIIGIITSIVVIVLINYLYKNINRLLLVEKIGYSCILAGAIGNMIDRYYRGFVIDMLDFRGVWVYVFNLADVWINMGVAFIIIDQLFLKKGKKNEEDK